MNFKENHIPPSPSTQLEDFATSSALMQDIYAKVMLAARLDQHIVLIGEMGVGKKRLAKLIHKYSQRSQSKFHTFYCIDISETQYKEAFWEHIHVEEEHVNIKYDVLERAQGGTLYMDQFSELSDEIMMNIIESYQRGCRQMFRFKSSMSPRLILSVNQDTLHSLVGKASWSGVLDRINPISIMLPPLRERKEDIPALIQTVLSEVQTFESSTFEKQITPEAIQECTAYSWPGNIRQLKNALLQGSVLSHGRQIESKHLPFSMSWKLPYP